MKLKKKLKSIWKILSYRESDCCVSQQMFPGDDQNFLVDFRADRFGFGGGELAAPQGAYTAVAGTDNAQAEIVEQQVAKIPVKPRDVLHELGRVPSNWSLDGLEAKIAIVESKREMISQHFAAQEMDGLIQCLKNRRKYDSKLKSGKTSREFFSQFDCTDQIKIEALLKKHDLVMQSADIFIPEFPDDAVKVMKECSDAVKELCEKKPHFFVIANKDQFRDAYGKRDPILLVQSPFGFYYYILGAWDKEMLYLPEL
jgi:hypothetical protein